MSIHDRVRSANERIATSGRAGEIEWIVAGSGMKLVYTDRFERENTLRVKSATEQERRKAQFRNNQAADERSQEAAANEQFGFEVER